MTELSKVKQNIHEHKDESFNLKTQKKQTQGPTELYDFHVICRFCLV